jgi:hypothetical protein
MAVGAPEAEDAAAGGEGVVLRAGFGLPGLPRGPRSGRIKIADRSGLKYLESVSCGFLAGPESG